MFITTLFSQSRLLLLASGTERVIIRKKSYFYMAIFQKKSYFCIVNFKKKSLCLKERYKKIYITI